jgi:hypothetical protein
MAASRKLFTVRHPDADRDDLLCDDVNYPAAKAAGYTKDGDDAPAESASVARSGGWQGKLRLEPPDIVPKDADVTLHFSQQFQGSPGSVAGLQFSDGPPNPGDPEDLWQWTTCRPVGGGGAVEAPGIQWDSRDTAFDLAPVQWHEMAFVRGGVWPDQGLTGPPVVASNAVKPTKLLSIYPALAPEEGPAE